MKRVILGAIFAAAIGITLFTYAKQPYCPQLDRTLSDANLIHLAIANGYRAGVTDISVSDDMVERFYRTRPDCCRVKRDYRSSSVLDALFNPDAVEVHVVYPLTTAAQRDYGGKTYEHYFIMGKCGQVYESYGGG